MKISNGKKHLAKIISENGGWREGAESAAQCVNGEISFWSNTARKDRGEDWCGHYLGKKHDIEFPGIKLPNWHQTILSRDEYFHLYPAPDADGWIEWKGGDRPAGVFAEDVEVRLRDGGVITKSAGVIDWRHFDNRSDVVAYRPRKPEQAKSAAVGDDETNLAAKEELEAMEYKPSIEQLAADYRNAKDFAERKQREADAAKADAEAKLAELVAAGNALGLVLSVADAVSVGPGRELVITDWRDLRVGDIVEVTGSDNPGWARLKGVESLVTRIGPFEDDVSFLPRNGDTDWAMSDNTEWRFIRRP